MTATLIDADVDGQQAGRKTPLETRSEGLRSVGLVGSFQPAAIAKLLPPEAAKRLTGLTGFIGVPLHSLAAALVGRGIKTTLIGGIRDAEPRFIEADPLSVAIYRGSGGWPFVLNSRRRERKEILTRLQEIQPEVVHAHWTWEGGRAVGDWRGPKILTVHDAAWEYLRLGWSSHPIALAFNARWLANTRATLARFRHVIAVSPYLETYLRLVARFRGEIRVIPNIIPELPQEFVPPDRFPKSKLVTFACYGNPGPLKNVLAAVKAFRIVAEKLPAARLLVFGGGWQGIERELSGSGGVEFRGALPHREFLRALVEEVDIWVHPARIEAHPLAICEAIQAGCPVVAGRQSGGVSWTLDYGAAGVLVDVENAHELAEAMHSLVIDRARSRRMVAHGRHFIRENFGRERILDLHLQYYRDVL